MTPMQMLKNNFLLLTNKLENFEEINLNKSKPKDIVVQNVDDEYDLSFPNEDTNFSRYLKKGVKTDFIKIYKAKTKKEKCSIAFHFNYLDVENPTIKCSVKQGESFDITSEMNINDFKEKLNSLINSIEDNNVMPIIEKVKETFLTVNKTNKLKR